MDINILNFKRLLEYFVCHQNYMASGESTNVLGYDKYIKPLIDSNVFSKTGQGYADDSIQNQVRGCDEYLNHQICINIQPNFGKYTSKKSYLNWRETGLNIFCEWNDDEVGGLSIGYAYWWKKPTQYEILLTYTLKDLALFNESDDLSNELTAIYNKFMAEYTDYRNHKGKYFQLENEYYKSAKKQEILEFMKPYTSILEHNHNLILTGAPGTGKTYLAKQIAALMIMGEEYSEELEENTIFKSHVGFTQFHPSYDYTDFVEGLRPTKETNGFVRTDGIFKAFCKEAINHNDGKPYIFIIDEINRGEISKIFGELFFSVDPGYRGKAGKVKTQYQNLIEDDDVFNAGFYVPENVYIIGTMNDIDRSVESMDFAFRRRFAFAEIKAMDNTAMLEQLGDSKDSAYNRMKHLNYIIWHQKKDNEPQYHQSIEALSSAYHIGASYFLKLKNYNGDFESLWSYHIEGVLREYLRCTEDLEENINRLKTAFDDDSNTDY